LGIEPTSDLKVIKKAYAARLKHTRPDDDAAAYQALREAYEAAQVQARWVGFNQQAYVLRSDAVSSAEVLVDQSDKPAAVDQETFAEKEDAKSEQKRAEPEPSSPAAETNEPSRRALEKPATWLEHQNNTLITVDQETPTAKEDTKPEEKGTEPESSSLAEEANESLRRSPDELVAWFEQRLQAGDVSNIAADWKVVEHELDALPLSVQAEASRCFADMAIKVRDLPTLVENALLLRFRWLSDFRAAQSLGAERMRALHSLFGGRTAFMPDQAFLDRYGAVTAFAQGVQRLNIWMQWLYIVLASSQLCRLWRQLQPEQRYAVGVDKSVHDRIGFWLKVSRWLRFALLAVLGACSGGSANNPDPWLDWLIHMLAIAALFFGGWVLGMVVHTLATRVRDSFANTFFHASNGSMRIGIPVRTLIATACLILALGLLAVFEDQAKYYSDFMFFVIIGIGVLLLFSFLLAQWRRTGAEGATLWILLLCVLVGKNIFVLANRPWTGAVAGALWFMLSMLIYNYHWQWIEAKASASWKLPALLVRLTIGWPYTLLVWSGKYAPALVIAGCGLALLVTFSGHLPLLFPVWIIFTLTIFGLDIAFAVCGRKLLDRPWKGWLQLSVLLIWLAWALVYLCAPQIIYPMPKTASYFETGWRNLVMIGVVPWFIVGIGVKIASWPQWLRSWWSGQ